MLARYLIVLGFININSLFLLDTSNHSISSANILKEEEKKIREKMKQMSNPWFM